MSRSTVERIGSRFLWWRYRLLFQARWERSHRERLLGFDLIVHPDVFSPTLFFSTETLGRHLDQGVLHGQPLAGSALDLGTGSGALALVLARLGWSVVATDISPIAVECARANVLRNGLELAVDLRQGDLFEPIGAARFDLIAFNPPFFSGQPTTWRDYAWRSTGILARFAAALPAHLTPHGRAVIITSSEMEPSNSHQLWREHRLCAHDIAHRFVWGSTLSLMELQPE